MYSFLKWQSDSNVVRAIGNPFQYQSHPEFIVKGRQPHEQKLKCPAISGTPCPLCIQVGDISVHYIDNRYVDVSSRSLPRWIIPVICRRVNDIRLMDMGYEAFRQLRNYARDSRWGNPEKYDIDISRHYATEECVVIPRPPMPLSDTDLVLQNSLNKDELNELTAPSIQDLLYITNHEYQLLA
jgi:hypothetical protein